MKRVICYIIIIFESVFPSYGQLPDGSTAPDFTFLDINGNTQNLYSYLNQGKYVAIDISATWCNPCWTYHNTKVMDSLYEAHDVPGDNTWKVFFMETDANTNSADLNGTGTNTQGNWVQGSNYIIIDPPSGPALNNFNNGYSLSFFPTLLLVCPNKKVFQDTLKGTRPPVKTWEYVANNSCFPAGIDNINDNNPVTIYPNPARRQTTFYFALITPSAIKLTVTNIMGQKIESKEYGILQPGDHSIKFDVSQLQPGIYFFTLTCGDKRAIRKKVLIQ